MPRTKSFAKILIANRGEIACRVIRTAHALGYATVAVYSDADADAIHARLADEAVWLGPPPAAASYLDSARVIAAAKAAGADAVHPGYGFLSENAGFAAACAQAGLVFIGPSVEAIRLMGDKALAKARMLAAGVPCVPGYQGDDQNDERFTAEADTIGYPVMVKAAAGGGGRGMRFVAGRHDLGTALKAARSEAANAFGDARLLLEKALVGSRHIEIQVFGDCFGTVVHLGERECSIQRRHQKVIEEAPSPAVDAALRDAMGAAAVAAAKAISYLGAGTVEFLLDADGAFHFLEMNTRLQVEHPVTEAVTGYDLVALQIQIAQGEPLPFSQSEVTVRGHAIEARLYAEDAERRFLPQTGTLVHWEPTIGEGVRVDHGLRNGSKITSFYDPLLAKVIAHGRDREEARRRLVRGIVETVALGVTTNKALLLAALGKPDFLEGRTTTDFIDVNFAEAALAQPTPQAVVAAALLFVAGTGEGFRSSRWGESVVRMAVADIILRVRCCVGADTWEIVADDTRRQCRVVERTRNVLRYEMDGHLRTAHFARDGNRLWLEVEARPWVFDDVTFVAAHPAGFAGDGVMRAPMSGRVLSMDVAEGDTVRRGQIVAVIEAMKMEHAVVAEMDGTIESVAAKVGAEVVDRDVLATMAGR